MLPRYGKSNWSRSLWYIYFFRSQTRDRQSHVPRDEAKRWVAICLTLFCIPCNAYIFLALRTGSPPAVKMMCGLMKPYGAMMNYSIDDVKRQFQDEYGVNVDSVVEVPAQPTSKEIAEVRRLYTIAWAMHSMWQQHTYYLDQLDTSSNPRHNLQHKELLKAWCGVL